MTGQRQDHRYHRKGTQQADHAPLQQQGGTGLTVSGVDVLTCCGRELSGGLPGQCQCRLEPKPSIEKRHFAIVAVPFVRIPVQTLTSNCRSEEHTSELQSLMRISYAVFCLKKKKKNNQHTMYTQT